MRIGAFPSFFICRKKNSHFHPKRNFRSIYFFLIRRSLLTFSWSDQNQYIFLYKYVDMIHFHKKMKLRNERYMWQSTRQRTWIILCHLRLKSWTWSLPLFDSIVVHKYFINQMRQIIFVQWQERNEKTTRTFSLWQTYKIKKLH